MKRYRTSCYKAIAILLIGAFAYMQGTALTCSIGHLFAAHHHEQQHHKNENKKCCSDFTQAFFSAFAKSQTVNADFSFQQPVTIFVVHAPQVTWNNLSCRESVFTDDSPYPPPKIPDIRIFIRSFQV